MEQYPTTNRAPSLNPEHVVDQFEANRARLRSVAYRMLGSTSDAEDAVQETWIRLSRSAVEVDNLGGWLTTVVSRVCLDMLRSRRTRREDPPPADMTEVDPEQEAVLADSVGSALLILLETLSPAERLAFVLHDMFAMTFDEIAPIIGRSPVASRQLASRARRRLQGTTEAKGDLATRQRIVDAFLAASRGGDFEALLRVLDPEAIMQSDAAAGQLGSPEVVMGSRQVAEFFQGRARAANPVLIDGVPGAAWSRGGVLKVIFEFRISEERIVGIDLIADPQVLAMLKVTPAAAGHENENYPARVDVDPGQDP